MLRDNLLICLILLVSPGWSQHCCQPDAPKYSEETTYADVYQVGDKIQFRCSPGYELFSSSGEKLNYTERSCLPDGTWSKEHHVCYRKRVLERKTSSGDCYVYNEADSKGWYGFNKNLRMDTSVSLVEVKVQHPVMLSMWVVHENCPYLKWNTRSQSPSTSFIFQQPDINKTNAQDSMCVVEGFVVYAKQEFSLCFLATYDIPSMCGDPETPANGLAFLPSRAVAYYACNPGYKLQGNKYRYCRRGFWTGKQPACERELLLPLEILSLVAAGLSVFTLLALLLTVTVISRILNKQRLHLAKNYSVRYTKQNCGEAGSSSRFSLANTYDDINSDRSFSNTIEDAYEEFPDPYKHRESLIYANLSNPN